MRPTPTEQLAAARRILGELVAPHVAGEYPAALLAGVIDALGVLERGWEDVPRFLVRDTERLRELLAEQGKALEAAGAAAVADPPAGAAGSVGDRGELLADIASFVAAPIPDATDLRALEAHHERGRELLVRAVPALAAADPSANSTSSAGSWTGSEALLRYFDDHIREFPLRPTPRVPPNAAPPGAVPSAAVTPSAAPPGVAPPNSAPDAKGSPSC